MGSLKNSEYSDLATLRDTQDKSPHGWATDTCGLATRTVGRLRATGLCELADDDTLSTLPGHPKWAARLTAEGHDTLLYVPQRRATACPPHPTTAQPEDAREVTLLPQAMDAVRLYLSLTGRLRRPPAPGLEEAVRTARREEKRSAWHLYVTQAQAESIAYALWLEARAHTIRSAHRFAREHDTMYKPSHH
ncbi:hypothetical protein [Streptomyces sp. NPDC000405]|uniref:hypothetical protein n=1 Tax=Streptomyces sp. NPDC000405 TaxID=3161033 RepID=UPI00398D2773